MILLRLFPKYILEAHLSKKAFWWPHPALWPTPASEKHFRAGGWSGPAQLVGCAGTKMWGEGSLVSLAAHCECWAAVNAQIALGQLSGSCAQPRRAGAVPGCSAAEPDLAELREVLAQSWQTQAWRLCWCLEVPKRKFWGFLGYVKAKRRLFWTVSLYQFCTKFGLIFCCINSWFLVTELLLPLLHIGAFMLLRSAFFISLFVWLFAWAFFCSLFGTSHFVLSYSSVMTAWVLLVWMFLWI